MARFLHAPRRSKSSWLIHVWTAFIVSGLMHALPSWNMRPNPPSVGAYENFSSLMIFFILQAVGLTLEAIFLLSPGEDLLLYEIGAKDVWDLGRVWTFAWLLYSGQFALDYWLKTGQGMLSVPYSFEGVVLKHMPG